MAQLKIVKFFHINILTNLSKILKRKKLHFWTIFLQVHTLNFKYNNETVHSVVDFDAQENWMTHHVFATSDLIGATIAMDEETVRYF